VFRVDFRLVELAGGAGAQGVGPRAVDGLQR